jgi:hypothetical protein
MHLPKYSNPSHPIPSILKGQCQVEYDIAYSMSGEISAVGASIQIGNVSCGADGVEQKFTTSFSRVRAKLVQPYSFAKTLVQDFVSTDNSRAKSGNPGYRPGLPVLSGTLITSDEKYPFNVWRELFSNC